MTLKLVQPDVYVEACPSREVLSRIGDKWTSLVLGRLADGPVRFADLERRVPGISRKMLTQTLRNCERDGLLKREMEGDRMPVKVAYSLTPLGESLLPIITQAKRWAEQHLFAIQDAREAYDRIDGVRIPI